LSNDALIPEPPALRELLQTTSQPELPESPLEPPASPPRLSQTQRVCCSWNAS
jgi:hypothetical protein